VADLKQFSRDTLYMTVGLVDLFLAKQVVLRKSLQLLGIACMVIAARFSEAEVITIREAAWLTDNTYRYEQVVRTMGQALCVARGRLRSSTHLDFVRMYIALTKVDFFVEETMHYVSELVLLFMSVATTSPSLVAAAVFYLTNLSRKVASDECWPESLQHWTAFSVADFAPTVIEIQKCCFASENVKDHRGVELKAVDERYQKRTGRAVADEFTAPTMAEVQAALIAHHAWPSAAPQADSEMDDDSAPATEEEEAAAASPSFGSPPASGWTSVAAPDYATIDEDMDIDLVDPPCSAKPARSSSALSNVTNGVLGSATHRRAKRSSSITTPLMPEMPPHPAGFNSAFEGFATFTDSEL
jgi:hypothetical protein